MKKVLFLLALLPGAVLADDAAVRSCRALPDAAARLACYDAMPLGRAGAVAPAAPAAPLSAAAGVPGFGGERMQKTVDALPKTMDSTVVGVFDGWGPNTRIKLANGQVWRVVDDSSAVLPSSSNAKVRIERNLFGTLFLTVEGSNSSAKVRRVE